MKVSYTALGALAATANAFLVPLNADDLATSDVSINQAPQIINLDCSSCPYALKSEVNGQHEWTNDVANDLEMKLQVVDNAITLNGVHLFTDAQPGLPPALTVTQKPKEGVETSMEGLDQDLRLSYSLEMAQKPFDDGNSLITITISPMALDGQMIRVDDVEIKAIKDSAGTITLHSVTTIAVAPDAADAQCNNVMCRVMSKLLSSITRVKSTAKAAAHKVKCLCTKCFHCIMSMMGHKHHHNHKGAQDLATGPHRRPDGTVELPSHHHFHPQDGRPHPQHDLKWHKKSFFSRVAHGLMVAITVGVIPVLIGLAFGMAAGAVGLLVGRVVVALWMRFRHGNNVVVYEVLPVDEKEEVPPPYEDLPVAVQEAIVEEKGVETKV